MLQKLHNLCILSVLILLPTLAFAQGGVQPVREQGTALTHLSNIATAAQLIDDMIHASDAALGKAALIGCQFDDTSPGTTTENNVRPVRCSTLRELYGIIRDAAGNGRGANVNASNELLVNANTELGAASSTPNSGGYAAPTAPDIWSYNMCKNGSGSYDPCLATPSIAHDAAASSANPLLIGGYASAAAPTDVSADTDAVRAWFLRNGAQVHTISQGGLFATVRDTGSNDSLNVSIVDASGNQVTSFGGSGGTASNFTSAFPSSGTAVGFSDGTNMQGARVFDGDSGAGTQYVMGAILRKIASGGTVEAGTSSDPLRIDPTGTTTQPVSLASVPSHAVTNAGTFAVQDSQVITDDAGFTAGTSKVFPMGFVADEASTDSVNEDDAGAARMTLDRIQWSAPAAVTASSQAATPCYVQSGTGTTASTNAANCKASAGNFFGVRAINTSASLAYLRMYNSSGTPTCSSATGFIESIPIPASTTGAGIVSMSMFPIAYTTGIAYCVTGGGANTDNTNAPAGVFITLVTK